MTRNPDRPKAAPMGKAASALILLLPAMGLCTVFIFIPALLAIIGPFHSFGITSQVWVPAGLSNYSRAMADPVFWVALRNNIFIVVDQSYFGFFWFSCVHGYVFPCHDPEYQVGIGNFFLIDFFAGLFCKPGSTVSACLGDSTLVNLGHTRQYDIVLVILGWITECTICVFA